MTGSGEQYVLGRRLYPPAPRYATGATQAVTDGRAFISSRTAFVLRACPPEQGVSAARRREDYGRWLCTSSGNLRRVTLEEKKARETNESKSPNDLREEQEEIDS